MTISIIGQMLISTSTYYQRRAYVMIKELTGFLHFHERQDLHKAFAEIKLCQGAQDTQACRNTKVA